MPPSDGSCPTMIHLRTQRTKVCVQYSHVARGGWVDYQYLAGCMMLMNSSTTRLTPSPPLDRPRAKCQEPKSEGRRSHGAKNTHTRTEKVREGRGVRRGEEGGGRSWSFGTVLSWPMSGSGGQIDWSNPADSPPPLHLLGGPGLRV